MAVVHKKLNPYIRQWNTARMWDLTKENNIRLHVYGVQRNHLNATYSDYFYPAELHQDYLDAFEAEGKEPPML
jgi:hypothetical protein